MVSIPEQRLFTRILRLTLLRGIFIGIMGILTGLWIYNFLQGFFSWEPTPFHIDGPLGSLYIILCGTTIVLQGEVTRLSSQFFARPRMSNGVWNLYNFSKHFVRLMGSLFMVLGFSLLIWKPLKFPDPTVSNDQQTSIAMLMALVFLGIFLCIGGISWFLTLRDKRRVEQKEPGGSS